MSERVKVRSWFMVGAGVLAALSAGGCAGGSGKSAGRPQLNSSAAESASAAEPARASGGLAFFDELEGRSLVSHDDALEGVLLVGTGRGGENYAQRLGAARALGWVDAGFDRPGREATTVGEVSRMLCRVLGVRSAGADEAVGEMASRGVVPPNIRAFQGLTGAQLVTMLGSVNDAMQTSGIARVPMPVVKVPAQPAPSDVTTSSPVQHTEPLPNLPLEGEGQGPSGARVPAGHEPSRASARPPKAAGEAGPSSTPTAPPAPPTASATAPAAAEATTLRVVHPELESARGPGARISNETAPVKVVAPTITARGQKSGRWVVGQRFPASPPPKPVGASNTDTTAKPIEPEKPASGAASAEK